MMLACLGWWQRDWMWEVKDNEEAHAFPCF